MKRREVRTFLLLSLPVLIIGAMAALVSLRGVKRDLGPPYRIVHHELIVGASKLSEQQKEWAVSSGLKLDDTAVYLLKVEGRRASFWDEFIWGDESIPVGINNSSCVEMKSGAYFTVIGVKSPGMHEDFYSLETLRLAEGKLNCSTNITWEKNGKLHSRTLDLIIEPDTLKPTP